MCQQGLAFEVQNIWSNGSIFLSYIVLYVDDYSGACAPGVKCPAIAPQNVGVVSLW